MSKIVLTDGEKLPLSVVGQSAAGNAVEIDSANLVYSCSDPTAGIFVTDEFGQVFFETSNEPGHLGDFQLVATVDLDPSDGVKEYIARLDIEVVASAAVTAAMVAGAPVAK